MKRRLFIQNLACLTVPWVLPSYASAKNAAETKNAAKAEYEFIHNSSELDTVILMDGLTKPFNLLHITDSHVSCDNESDAPYTQYSARMRDACAPGTRRHFKTREITSPLDCLTRILDMAKEQKMDFIALTGDIINYPSATAVAQIMELMDKTGIPWVYTAGNHDWHYEGMPGSSDDLRKEWIEKRLKPLYQGENPFCSSRIINGLNVVTVDNSTYQINDEQLKFYRQQANRREPLVLFMHIPLYMPSLHICCGHPQWGAATDRGWQVETRERWPESGNNAATIAFVKEVMKTKNLAGVFTGHWHEHRMVSCQDKIQYVTSQAGDGRYRVIHFRGKQQI